jgi:hypothetical protein
MSLTLYHEGMLRRRVTSPQSRFLSKLSNFRQGLVVSLIILLSLFLGIASWWGRSGNAFWPGYGPYRILEMDLRDNSSVSNLRLYELVPELSKARALDIPLDLKITSYGFPGEYEVRGIYALSLAEKGDMSLLERSLEEGLGLAINGIVVRNHELSLPSRVTVQNLFLELLKARQITLWEWWQVFHMSRLLQPDIPLLQIESLTAFMQKKDVDGSDYFALYEPGFDVWYEKHMPVLSSQLRDITVTVENTTLQEGRGATVGRLFGHQGFTVLHITDGLPVLSSEILIGEKAARLSEVRDVVRSLFPHIPVREADISGYRADVVVRIAGDW